MKQDYGTIKYKNLSFQCHIQIGNLNEKRNIKFLN